MATRSTCGRENNIFTLADARTFVADPRRFQLLTLYERRIHTNMTKSLKQLTELQATRRAAAAESAATQKEQREQALEEARLLTQLDEMEGTPCDPAATFTHPNGFIISNAEIIRSIRYLGTPESSQTSGILQLENIHSARRMNHQEVLIC